MDRSKLAAPSKRKTLALTSLLALTLGLEVFQDPTLGQELELTAPLVEPIAAPTTPPRKLTETAAMAILTAAELPELSAADFPHLQYVPSIVGEMVSFRESLDLDDFGFESESDRNQPPPLDRGIVQEGSENNEDLMDDLMDLQAVKPTAAPRAVYQLKSISDITFHHPAKGALPEDRALAILDPNQISWPPAVDSTVYWVAPNLYYKPLLWEDPLLERYGQSARPWGLQPVLSGIHFTVDSGLFPFRAIKNRCQWETPLAFERPGSCPQPVQELRIRRK